MNVLGHLRRAFAAAAPAGADPGRFAAAVRPCADPRFGDYQAGGCLAMGYSEGIDPRELAGRVAEAVDLAPLAGRPDVAGPGYLNVRLNDDWMALTVGDLLADGGFERFSADWNPVGSAPVRTVGGDRPEKCPANNADPGAELQQVCARVRALFRDGGTGLADLRQRRPAIVLGHPAERALALGLLRLPETLDSAEGGRRPGVLTGYLDGLANDCENFLDECLVLKAPSPERRDSRLALCDLTDRALKFGLDLLGINVSGYPPGA
jgi:arginyl-tRNA synthetase